MTLRRLVFFAMNPLDGIVHKIIRAEDRLTEISAEVAGHEKKCRVLRDRNVKTNLIDLIADFPNPPLMLSVMVGECLYNLRSALDHLVWQLVESNPPNHGTPRNQYPICQDSNSFAREIKGHRLDGVSAAARAVIEGLQPYNEGQAYSPHPLWLLDQLVNVDKHRFLTLTCVTTQNLLGDVAYSVNRSGPVMCSVQSNQAESVQKELEKGLSIAFKELPAEDLDVEIHVRAIIEYIEMHLLPRFGPFFK